MPAVIIEAARNVLVVLIGHCQLQREEVLEDGTIVDKCHGRHVARLGHRTALVDGRPPKIRVHGLRIMRGGVEGGVFAADGLRSL